MATFRNLEDLQVWGGARDLNKLIFKTTNSVNSLDNYLVIQIKRSSSSIMDNIAEGFGRGGNKEFIHFLTIARGSSAELKSQVYQIYDQGYLSEEFVVDLISKINQITGKISKLIVYLKKSKHRGFKFSNKTT